MLASHSSEESRATQVQVLNTALQHIEVQENLPQAAVEGSTACMPALSPQKIIQVMAHPIMHAVCCNSKLAAVC